MRKRILILAGVFTLALALVLALGSAANSNVAAETSDGDGASGEQAQEEAKAAAAETAKEEERPSVVVYPSASVPFPLLVGVDDVTIPAYRIEPATAAAVTAFSGVQVWAAAFDPGGNRILLTSGSTLHEWPIGAPTFNTLGLITSSSSGATLVMEGLGYANGTVYGSRVGNTAADPEGIYSINPATQQATLVTTYTVPIAQTTISGLDADPVSGIVYGTNDSTTGGLRGLVQIDLDGTVSVVAPYPAGQTDIDGLAVGDGKAFLVTDEPGFIYVYDFSVMTYTTPITNPWTTAEVFSAGAWIYDAGPVPNIAMDKTVGTDPDVCASSDSIGVGAGTDVTYCYEVTNTGNVTFTTHDLVDSELGALLTNFPYVLVPGASAFLTETTNIAVTTVNTATWTADDGGGLSAAATDTARVNVLIPEPLVCNGTPVAFESGIPLDWTVVDNTGGTGIVWTTTADTANCGIANLTNGSGEAACADSDHAGLPAVPYDTELVSNVFDLTGGFNSVTLNTAAYYRDLNAGTNDMFQVDIWNGSAWVNLLTWNENHQPEDISLDLSAYAGMTGLQVRYRYSGNGFDWYAQVDDVSLTCQLTLEPPDIAVDPAALETKLAPDAQATLPLTITNNGEDDLTWTIEEGPSGAESVGGWSDNFDSYQTGSQLHGQGGWKGWFDDPAAGALAVDTQAQSAPNSAEILGASDLVREYAGYTSGVWTYTAWQYVPAGFSGESYFIMLNSYNDGGAGLNWSTQVSFNSVGSVVTNDGISGGTLPLITGQWVELRVVIDLDNDTQDFYYNNQLLYSGTWTDEVSGGGALNIGAVDLYANSATAVYYDDLSLVEVVPTGCDAPGDIPWVSASPTSGTTVSNTSSVVDVTFDSTSLAGGVYTGTLCINSNDPDEPLVEVPLTLEVNEPPLEPTIALTKTVGTDPAVCAATDSITVPVGTAVTYCYTVENTGPVTVTTHDLDDSELGALLTGFSYDLAPGASTFVTATAVITEDTVNTATWTAYTAGGQMDSAMDSASVTVEVEDGHALYLPVVIYSDASASAGSSAAGNNGTALAALMLLPFMVVGVGRRFLRKSASAAG